MPKRSIAVLPDVADAAGGGVDGSARGAAGVAGGDGSATAASAASCARLSSGSPASRRARDSRRRGCIRSRSSSSSILEDPRLRKPSSDSQRKRLPSEDCCLPRIASIMRSCRSLCRWSSVWKPLEITCSCWYSSPPGKCNVGVDSEADGVGTLPLLLNVFARVSTIDMSSLLATGPSPCA